MYFEDIEDAGKLNKDDIVIALFGPTGVGKNYRYADRRIWQTGHGHGLMSYTSAVGAVRIRRHPKYEDRIVLVDTPGFDDTTKSDKEILQIIAEWLVAIYKTEVFVHGLIYVQRITDNRMSGAHRRNLLMFGNLCGEKASEKVLFVTTMWDAEDVNIGEQREAELKNYYWKNLGLGESCERFDNTSDSAWYIVDTLLLTPVDCIALQLQEEICNFGSTFEETKAVRALYKSHPNVLDQNTSDARRRPHLKTSLNPIWFRKGDIMILVMGTVGAGKSTFINALLGEQRMPVNHGLQRSTDQIQLAAIDSFPGQPNFRGHRLVIVEIPGFDDTYMEDAAILRRTAEWLASAYRQKMVLGGVIYLHDISQSRLSKTAQMNLEVNQQLCGESALRKVAIGTTHWGTVSQDFGAMREIELKKDHWKDMLKNGSTTRQFLDNSAWIFVDHILQTITQPTLMDIPLQIQTELVVEKKIIPETRAGKMLQFEPREVLEMQKQHILMSAWPKVLTRKIKSDAKKHRRQ